MLNVKNARRISATMLMGLLIFGLTSLIARAVVTLPATVIDDFEDGDVSDWIFFGGNNAGGGGGPADDRPKEGNYYFSTGWGGDGTASGFYGGAFRNFDNPSQVTPPADPWFNVWVLNQSDTSVDQYNLEITLREDTDGNGWTDGSEDSIQLVTTFSSTDFDDEWVLISAPLSSFTNVNTGGDGSFNGNLDEIVIVLGAVEGPPGSAVELDFDQFSFTSGGPVSSSFTLFDDMEHGDPLGNGWFAFDGSEGGGGIMANDTDLPPSDGGVYSLESGWGSGGTPGFFGGFGRTNPVDLSETDHFNFWINPDASQDYTLEINLQDDDNNDGNISSPEDDEFQFNCVVSPTGPCAVSGGGWQRVSIPLADFVDDNSFLTGGNGVLDAVPASNGGNGQLINVVVAVISSGSDVNFRIDYWAFSDGPLGEAEPTALVDDFENGLPTGADGDGVPIGFYTFSDGSPIGISTTNMPPAAVPGAAAGNNVLAMTAEVMSFAGFIHGFENTTVDTWVPQDWSGFEGFSLWFYGQSSGTTMFIDVIDNRNPGSTVDDGERFSVSFIDDFTGWQQLTFPFNTFTRKEVGNGAPNDGFTLTQIHGWALGALTTPGEVTWYVDDAALFGVAEIPELEVTFTANFYGIDEGTTGDISVKLNRPMNSDDPVQVSVDYSTEPGSATPGLDYDNQVAGTLHFINGGPTEMSFPIQTFEDSKFEGGESILLKLSNPMDVMAGFTTTAAAAIIDDDEFDPDLVGDFERFPYRWDSSANLSLSRLALSSDDPMARPGQDDVEGILRVDAPLAVEIAVLGKFCRGDKSGKSDKSWKSSKSDKSWNSWKTDKSDKIFEKFKNFKHFKSFKNDRGIIRIALLTTDDFDALTVDHTTVTLGDASEFRVKRKTGEAKRRERDVDNDGDLDLVFHFRAKEAGVDCDADSLPFNGFTFDGQPITAGGSEASFNEDFAIGNDWSRGEALNFWYYGTGSGDAITVNLKDNRAPDPGPSGWGLVWSEEFNEPAGTPPNPEHWTYELGDGSVNFIPGWGNEELQYYTDDPANAATDGNGNMLLTVLDGDGSQECYYGPCEYTSARLISWRKAEFAYGRIESRISVPDGPSGLWPAFWSLGTDIDVVGWPQTGEIDFLEYVSRLPNEIFGTIHGPGYAGGASFNGILDFGEPVFNDYHTYAIEWEPDLINWYVDDILYHSAIPSDVAPNEWVFNDPIFLLLNVAIGGNFGGAVDPSLQGPQSMAVDYIRVFQAPDTAERFEASFVDNFVGWQQVEVPFADFTRSGEQPAGAPDDGLTLTEVWGYGFTLPDSGTTNGHVLLDQVRLKIPPPPLSLTVTNLDDSGAGSLREALATIGAGGTISFDPGLAGNTIGLMGPLVIERDVTIDASAAQGVIISGSGLSRVFQVLAGTNVAMNDLVVADGAGAPQGGGILNLGTLSLDRVVVRDNMETSGGPAGFDLGGGGIYNGDGATLNLTDSTVMNNQTLNQPGGGIYGFFNSTINITRSTISGNVGADVAGGLRTLGNANIANSTISGNTSTVWHGGALFATDGTVSIANSTIVGNNAPGGTAGGLMVATFGAPVNVTVSDSIIADNGTYNCQVEGGAAAMLTSLGGSVNTDPSCALIGTDQDVGAGGALVDALADNGGPTFTHALQGGSPAIDSAVGACPATDQRGVARPQGGGCDVGAFESP